MRNLSVTKKRSSRRSSKAKRKSSNRRVKRSNKSKRKSSNRRVKRSVSRKLNMKGGSTARDAAMKVREEALQRLEEAQDPAEHQKYALKKLISSFQKYIEKLTLFISPEDCDKYINWSNNIRQKIKLGNRTRRLHYLRGVDPDRPRVKIIKENVDEETPVGEETLVGEEIPVGE